jgi:predicted ATPase
LGHDAALNASRAPLGRLPTLPNRTIGRAGDVRSVVEKLRAGGMRLLTLTGPGGVGKTRLALEVARAVEADFADGAWFVSLAETAHAHDVAGAVVTTLGVVPLTGESAEEAVERFLAAKHLLLVIDNCEHLPAAAPFIGRLSVVGPGVKVLATSREPLAVQAERVHPVPPLALPDPGTEIDRRALAQSGAVALFCERARAHEDVDFELTGDNAGAIVEICRRVDGLPLAIELAAARCGLLSPAEIAVHLDVALRGLGTGPRDAPARQRTLRATLNWSHGLLDDEERAGFARFAVFAGGATVHAAEAVTGTSLDTLERLVAKSLLVRSRQARGPTRLAMLETVRAYAEERFAALADCDSIRERHFDHFLALARLHGTEQALHGHDRKEHLACLDGEVENLRAALGWAAGQHRGGQTLALSTALLDYWLKRDRYAEAVDWVMTALRTSDPMADAATRARALCKVCWALLAVGRAGEIAARLEDADEISRTLADPAIRAEVLYNHAALMGLDDRPDLAWPLAEEAVACADATGDSWLIAMTAWARVLASETPEQVRDSVKHAAPLLQRVGNIYHLACLFANATTWSACQGCDDDAAEYLRRAVPLVRELDDPSLWMLLRGDAGLLALAAGERDAARDAFCDALGLSHDLVHLPALGDALTGLAAVAAVDEDVPRAARLAGAAAAHGVPDDSFAARLERTFLEPARARCTAAEWRTAAAEGAGLSLDQAIHYARQRPSSRPPALGGGRLRAIVPDAAGV